MGPLSGVKVIELAGIGPCPMCGMLLAELGATVLKVDRISPSGLGLGTPTRHAFLHRSRPSVAIDLKHPEGVALVLKLCGSADALIEGFRPGVTEKLGLGPEACAERNPRLVYGRVTGWGQTGPLAKTAGHDLNFIALTGALHAVGRAEHPPTPPLNLVGDFGGGALYLALGIVAAVLEARSSGQGQVVDAAMVDGGASLMTGLYGLRSAGLMNDERGSNVLDGGAHYYDVYKTRDGKYIALAPIEPRFYAALLEALGVDTEALPQSTTREDWPALKLQLASLIETRTRDEWAELLEGTDACFAPVLSMAEAPHHAHNRARGTFVERDGGWQPNASPRFSRTATEIKSAPAAPGEHSHQTLVDWGIDAGTVHALIERGVVAQRGA